MIIYRPRGHLKLGWRLLGMLSLAVFVALPMVARAQVGQMTPQEVVVKFSAFEFGGAGDTEERTKLVHFSGAQMRKLSKIMYPVSPYVFQWRYEPLEVVDSYKVGKILVSGDDATALVTYEVVAKRSSWNGPIVPVVKKAVTTRLELKLYRKRWKVENPPFPRVSKRFLISSYLGAIPKGQGWYQEPSSEQLLWLRDAIDNVLLLKKLK